MQILARILIALNALIHLYIAWFEIAAWTSVGRRVFSDIHPSLFEHGSVMAANQGLYNGFLAVGLVWSLWIKDTVWQRRIATCFLLFIAIAGIFGAVTASMSALYAQTVPASLALAALWGLRAKA